MKLFKIFHHYDLRDQSAFIYSDKDPTEAALYCQFMAEEWIDDGVSLPNDVIANALIKFYGCEKVFGETNKDPVEIDMYFAREEVSASTYIELKDSLVYEKAGLKEFLVTAVEESVIEQAKQRALQLPDEEVSVELSDAEVFNVTYKSKSAEFSCSRVKASLQEGN